MVFATTHEQLGKLRLGVAIIFKLKPGTLALLGECMSVAAGAALSKSKFGMRTRQKSSNCCTEQF